MVTVFMAEDDQLLVSIYARLFKNSSIDFKMALDGELAIRALKAMETKPSIVILDVMMPRKDGFEVLKEMKATPALKDIPVIILTNLSGQEDLKKGLDLGAELSLVKSQYGPMEILKIVKEIYNKHNPDKI